MANANERGAAEDGGDLGIWIRCDMKNGLEQRKNIHYLMIVLVNRIHLVETRWTD
jgi:hypothetical protein